MVGDRPPQVHPYTHHLNEAGFEVSEASRSTEALRQIQSREFDLVISVSMPEAQGLDLVRRIRTNSPSPQVVLVLDAVVVEAKRMNRIAFEATRLGALQSLVEPIELKLLEQTAMHAVRLNRAGWNRGSKWTDATSVTATKAKQTFANILERAIRGGRVVITKHNAAKAVLVSVEEFNALMPAADVELDTLSQEFDDLLARMQTSQARAGMRSAFASSAKELGAAAVAAARERG